MAVWDDVLSERDRRVIEASGHAARRGLGERPVVFVVDAQDYFVGIKDDIFASLAVYPTSVGEEAWVAVGHIRRLLDAARQRGIPVMYSKSGMKRGEEASLFDMYTKYADVLSTDEALRYLEGVPPPAGAARPSAVAPAPLIGTAR